MTKAQKTLRLFVSSRFHLEHIQIANINDDTIIITDANGDTMKLTLNIYGDIVEILNNGKTKIIAESNLPHDLLKVGSLIPTEWTDIPYSRI